MDYAKDGTFTPWHWQAHHQITHSDAGQKDNAFGCIRGDSATSQIFQVEGFHTPEDVNDTYHALSIIHSFTKRKS